MSSRRVASWMVMGAVVVVAHDAAAQKAQLGALEVVKLQEGYGGALDLNGGPGIEQPDVAYIEKDDRHFVVSVYMSSDVTQGFWQCKCSSIELTEAGPKVIANGVQLTFNEGGYRPCNHPRIAADEEHLVWMYGSDASDLATTRTYAGVLDHRCGHVIPPRQVSDTNENDSGSPDLVANGEGRFTAGYLYAGNGGETHVLGLSVSNDVETNALRLDPTFRRRVITPANIGRPSIAADGPDRVFMCAAEGNQRPPEEGIRCAYIDAETGDILQDQLILEAKPNDGIFYNSPVVRPLEFGRFSVQVMESTGKGRKAEERGATKSHIYVYEPTDNAIVLKAQMTDADVEWSTHAAHCTGKYGTGSRTNMALMGAPITGAGSPTMQMVSWSAETDFVVKAENKWIVAKEGDSGHLSNLYGANPEKQGRDYLRCIGDVPNPGYDPDGSIGGTFMPEVESFFVMPVVGKLPTEPKNSLSMSFVPGASAVELTAPDRAPGDEKAPGDTESGGSTVVGGDGEQVGGCTTSETGSSTHSSGAWLVAFALGLLAERRRRATDRDQEVE